MHGVGELLRRVGSRKRLGLVAERVQDEGDLEPVARAEVPVELRGAPGKLVHVGGRRALRVRVGESDDRDAEVPVALDGREQLVGASIGV